ncbi:MAG: phosphotransferase [Myxococcota bacterium]
MADLHLESLLRDFLAHHGLPGGSLVRADGGVVNPCFLTDEHAIRVNVRDPELPKFANEAVALRLAASAIAVPEVVVLDTARSVVPHDVLVTERIHAAAVETLPEADQTAFVVPAAEWLAQLHEVRAPGFGSLHAPSEVPNWPTFVAERMEAATRAASERGFLTSAQLDRAARRVLDGMPDTEPRLAHQDWHFGNLLQRDGRLVAALDFEWSQGFDVVAELVAPLDGHPHRKRFIEAYRAVRPLPDDLEDRLERYTLLEQVTSLRIRADKLAPAYAWAARELEESLAWLRSRLGP